MSDPETTPEQDATPPPPSPMEAPPHPEPVTATKSGASSFSIWPPTQQTRDAVINHIIETLTTPSVLSKRYGTVSPDEASAAARQIEDEAFAAAGVSASAGDDGIEILQVYSTEISKRMLDTVKARAPASSAADNGGASDVPDEEGVAAAVSDS
ncbi:MFP1 attachment factor 1-like [Gastrolobium bilobum]|uniref:MFP1 attachment factor 1-like n=1 Tax=Gastrolobium bilobum TaxID=150636 RepID=UPI002AB1C6A5|nr:MFP1 attachment factor 1-like [Gastrolobium bilobum]